MAGYIMTLGKPSSKKIPITTPLENCVRLGVYSTNINPNKNHPDKWGNTHEATLSDYATMKEGDNIYFFIDRKIYGIGTLKNIGCDCKFNNFPLASEAPEKDYLQIRSDLLVDFGINSPKNRWLCTFEPTPHFFRKGVDMDEVLSSNPTKFRMLRAFSKLSFLKIDDEENKALKDIILKRNEEFLFENTSEDIFEFDNTLHSEIAAKLLNSNYYLNTAEPLIACYDFKKNILGHEMALECGLLSQLSNNDAHTLSIFGKWDYISHQVIASPFKPLEYIDKMDIFGYRYIPGYTGTISKYLLMELKKDAASPEDLNQVMKYVDWISQEYAFGDYDMINAFLVAKTIPKDVIDARNTIAQRNFIKGRRPPTFGTWTNLTLVEYTFNSQTNKLEFNIV